MPQFVVRQRIEFAFTRKVPCAHRGDPATLLPYSREEQVYWFASLGNGEGRAILESDHLVCTTKYEQ